MINNKLPKIGDLLILQNVDFENSDLKEYKNLNEFWKNIIAKIGYITKIDYNENDYIFIHFPEIQQDFLLRKNIHFKGFNWELHQCNNH